MVNSRNLKKFAEATKSYLLFGANNLKQIKKFFLSVIDSDEEKYQKFEEILPSLKETLKQDLKFFNEQLRKERKKYLETMLK